IFHFRRKAAFYRPPFVLLCTPSMGVISRVKVPNGGWRAPTVAEGKGVRREAESEGSRRLVPGFFFPQGKMRFKQRKMGIVPSAVKVREFTDFG
ncbi:hypothetical protein, partial [Paenibacillus sp. YK5]